MSVADAKHMGGASLSARRASGVADDRCWCSFERRRETYFMLATSALPHGLKNGLRMGTGLCATTERSMRCGLSKVTRGRPQAMTAVVAAMHAMRRLERIHDSLYALDRACLLRPMQS